MELPARRTNQDLIAVSASTRNVTSNQSVWNFLINTGEVIFLIRPLLWLPLPKVSPARNILSFLLLIIFLSGPFLPIKTFCFVHFLGGFDLDAARFTNCSVELVRSLVGGIFVL